MLMHCRNCGAAREIPDYHGPVLVICPKCDWQETLPSRRHLPKSLDNRAGHAFEARAHHHEEAHHVVDHVTHAAPMAFERFCASMFGADGYDVTFADQIFDQSHALELRAGQESVFVACRSGAHRIHVEDIQRLVGAMRHAHASGGRFVTTGTFEPRCIEIAETGGVELIDAEALTERLVEVPHDQLRAWLLAMDAPGSAQTPP